MNRIIIFLLVIVIACNKDDKIIFKGMAKYCVDKTGQDLPGRDGLSTATAWANLSYACSRVAASAGHIIHINAGTYTISSQVSVPVGVNVEGDSKATTILTYGVTTIGQYALLLSSISSNTNGNQYIRNLTLKSTVDYASHAAIGIMKRGNVEVYNCNIINFSYYGIALHNGEQTGSYAVGNKVHDCTITNCSGFMAGDSRGALNILSQDGLLIYNNQIVNARPNGNNGNCIDGVEGFIKNMKVYNNTLQKTFVYGVTTWEFCIEIWNWEGGNEIYNNVITGSVDIQYAVKGSSTYSVWVHDNIIGQPVMLPRQSMRGVLLEERNSDVIIERNHFHDICQGIYMRGQTSGVYNHSNIYIRYNLFTNIGAASGGSAPSPSGWGFYSAQTDYDDTFNNFNFYNNVVIASTAANALTTCWGCGIPDCGVATGVNISNNIIMNFDTAPIVGQGWNQGTRADQVAIFNNIFYNNGNSNAVKYNTGFTVTNLTGISPQTNLIQNPPFVSSSNYHLTQSRIGKYITTGLTDKDGVTVSNPPTIGAYEYGSLPVIIPVTTVTVTGQSGAITITVDKGTLQMYAHIDPHNATDQTVTWSVVNGTGEATINSTGLLTAIKNGTVTVKAISNG
jgi:hypothetical protein